MEDEDANVGKDDELIFGATERASLKRAHQTEKDFSSKAYDWFDNFPCNLIQLKFVALFAN